MFSVKQNFECIIVNFLYQIKHVLDGQKNLLIETVLLNTHSIYMFGLTNKKNNFQLRILI